MANVVLVYMWLGLTAYVLFAGADFGAGFWDLVAGSAEEGAPKRALIQRVIAPVWEANHVWLIFVLVVFWTGFPRVFAAVASTLYVPLTAAAIGIILRGSSFAFRKAVPDMEQKRALGAAFAASSVVTPFFLGTVAGAVASGRVPLGNAAGDVITSWLNPTSVLGGSLAVLASSFLAAVFLCRDAEASAAPEISEWFRRRALASGVVAGAVALAGIAVLHSDAPRLFHGLTHRALPVVLLSALAALSALVLTARRHYVLARPAAGIAVGTIVWGWAVGQYPYLLEPSVRVHDAVAARPTLTAIVISLSIGLVIIVPSLLALLALAQTDRRSPEAGEMLGGEATS